MTDPTPQNPATLTSRLFATGLVAIVMLLILPLPSLLLDILLAISITVSLLVFLLAINFDDPIDFSTFPTVLLVATILRLSLNIASTRLILLHGHEGPESAGNVIFAFGQFVVGGNYVVGIVVFLILVVINFKVLTAGAGRIAEVAARFTLDAMPGKQMAIDNELANGHIDESEARRRRKRISEEADFYGAMDGANKFVKGDAVAGLIITAINLLGGIIIGMVQSDLPLADAAATYTILTIGDGLVSQVPALLVSTAAGLMASRTSKGIDLGGAFRAQLFGRQEPLFIGGFSLIALALVPGMPTFAFLLLGSASVWLGRISKKKAEEPDPVESATTTKQQDAEPPLSDLMAVDLLALEVGFDLVPLVDKQRGGELLKRIGQIRKQLAQELGVIVPPVRVRDNLQLKSGTYRLILSGTAVGGGDLQIRRLLAIDPGTGVGNAIPGDRTKDPAFGLPAIWISSQDRERADLIGFTVVEPAAVAATHLTELLKRHAAEFLGRAEAQELIDNFALRNPKLVEEVIPTILPLGEVIKVLKLLLAEGISIRDLRTILESIADHAGKSKEPETLVELIRQDMSRTLTSRFASEDGIVHALILDPQVEQAFRGTMNGNGQIGLNPTILPRIIKGLENALVPLVSANHDPLLLTAPDIRPTVVRVAARHAPGLAVMSFREVDPRSTVKTSGVVKLGG